jgi:hypothetical protein
LLDTTIESQLAEITQLFFGQTRSERRAAGDPRISIINAAAIGAEM